MNKRTLLLSIVILNIMISCKNESEPEIIEKGLLSISIEAKEVNKNGRINTSGIPNTLFITIKDSEGEYVYNLDELNLVDLNGDYVSENIELKEGDYTIEDFIVADSDDESVFIIPKSGSDFESFVSNPLPFQFSVVANSTLEIVLEVVSATAGTSDEFGYLSINFIEIETEAEDIEGNKYPVVRIGDLLWLGKNLKTKTYNNGDPILTTNPANLDISSEDPAKYYWYPDFDVSNEPKYGLYYTWDAANDTRGICPEGMRVSTSEDWSDLYSELGGQDVAAGPIKSVEDWDEPNIGATNSTGLDIKPAGARATTGQSATGIGRVAWLWTSTAQDNSLAKAIQLSTDSEAISFWSSKDKNFGYCIRCVKDIY